MVIPRRARSKGGRLALVVAAALLWSLSPVSPVLGIVSADGSCSIAAFGGRNGATSAWGEGNANCVGDAVTASQTLSADPCSLDVVICLIWGDGPNFATCTTSALGSHWCPSAGVATANGLATGTRYRIQNHVTVSTGCCGVHSGDAYSGDFRL